MRVLIVYGSRYGATQGIAERIGATLRQQGLEVTVQPARETVDPAHYEAVIVGSAAYFFHWMKQPTQFVRRNRNALAARPVWLFSSGPLGTKADDDEGRDLRVVREPKEIAEFRETIKPRDHRVFFGAIENAKLSFTHRIIQKVSSGRGNNEILPEGDFRDWDDIDAWASTIAESLRALPPTAG
jgi:menaquinone-dependent protoporphyrinogen oxidase